MRGFEKVGIADLSNTNEEWKEGNRHKRTCWGGGGNQARPNGQRKKERRGIQREGTKKKNTLGIMGGRGKVQINEKLGKGANLEGALS